MAEFIHVETKTFFDKAGVIAAMDRKTNRVLSSTGAYSRKVMQRGMRRRKKVSLPGDYPSAHGNALLREKIFFGFDQESRSLIVGPNRLHRTDREVAVAGKTVPQLVNEGGTIFRKLTFDRKTKRFRHTNRPRRQVYRPRPFVELTLPIAAKKLGDEMQKQELK